MDITAMKVSEMIDGYQPHTRPDCTLPVNRLKNLKPVNALSSIKLTPTLCLIIYDN